MQSAVKHRFTTNLPQREIDYHTFQSYWAVLCTCGEYTENEDKYDLVVAHLQHIR